MKSLRLHIYIKSLRGILFLTALLVGFNVFSQTVNFESDCLTSDFIPLVGVDGTGRNMFSDGSVEISYFGLTGWWRVTINGSLAFYTISTSSPNPPTSSTWVSNGYMSCTTMLQLVVNGGSVASSLSLWLKADEGSNTSVDGNNVTSWQDQSSNSYSADADVNATDYPVYRSNSVNFNPGIEFDGDFTDYYSDGLHLGTDFIYSNNAGIHVFVVCDPFIDLGTDKYVFDFGLQSNSGYGMIYSNNDYGLYSNSSSGGTNTELTHGYGDDPAIVESRFFFNDAHSFHRNGIELVNVPITLPQLTNAEVNESSSYGLSSSSGPVSIGRKSASVYLENNNGRIFDGQINEVIVYNDTLSQGEIEKIESYLAIKYGVNLNHDYVNSTGTILKSQLGSYTDDIAGIGRDDGFELNQKQSKSISSDAIITLGLQSIESTNAINTNSFSADNNFVMWANDGASPNASWNVSDIAVTGQPNAYKRIDRTWQLNEMGTVSDCVIQVDVDDVDYNILDLDVDTDGLYYLFVDNDDDFTNGGTSTYPMSNTSGSLWQATIDPESSYFTIGMKILLPAEICNNGIDDDLDTFIDCLDTDCNLNVNCPDWDGDLVNDQIDIDDDNDGIPDSYERECNTPDSMLKWRNPLDQYFNNGSPGNNEVQSFTVSNGTGVTYSVDLSNMGSASQVSWSHNYWMGQSLLNPYANFTNKTESWSFDLDFDADQSGMSFLVRDIDLQDAIGVIGFLDGVTVSPFMESFAPEMSLIVEGDGSWTAYSSVNSNVSSTDPRSIVKVTFYSPIDKLRIIRKSNPNLSNDPGYGALEICDLTACNEADIDTDGDGVYDHLDLDSDNDGIYDGVESGNASLDSNYDGMLEGSLGLNGLVNVIETAIDSGYLISNPTDSDGDSRFDFLELDSDNDSCHDTKEAGFPDSNNDGMLGGIPLSVDVYGRVIFTP